MLPARTHASGVGPLLVGAEMAARRRNPNRDLEQCAWFRQRAGEPVPKLLIIWEYPPSVEEQLREETAKRTVSPVGGRWDRSLAVSRATRKLARRRVGGSWQTPVQSAGERVNGSAGQSSLIQEDSEGVCKARRIVTGARRLWRPNRRAQMPAVLCSANLSAGRIP
jgi:hypothetical protein